MEEEEDYIILYHPVISPRRPSQLPSSFFLWSTYLQKHSIYSANMLSSLRDMPDSVLAGKSSGHRLLLGHRQVDALMERVDRLPSPEDWTIMEEALAAILDEAAGRAQQLELDAAQEQSKGSGVCCKWSCSGCL